MSDLWEWLRDGLHILTDRSPVVMRKTMGRQLRTAFELGRDLGRDDANLPPRPLAKVRHLHSVG